MLLVAINGYLPGKQLLRPFKACEIVDNRFFSSFSYRPTNSVNIPCVRDESSPLNQP